MSLAVFLQNVAALVVQGVLVTAVAAALVRVLPIERPALELAWWRTVLLLTLALPFLGIWTQGDRIEIGLLSFDPVPASSVLSRSRSYWPESVVTALAIGLASCSVRLALGARRLRIWRLRAVLYDHAAFRGLEETIGARAEIRLSPDVTVPATFGLRHPVVLLPTHVTSMEAERQRAIVAHELIHVRRADWPGAVAEEILAAVLWFHPAVHFLLGRIRLARERSVDAAVVKALGGRRAYLESLLEVARHRLRAEPVPAALFLGERHLTARVEFLLKEVMMSKLRALSHLFVCALVLAVAGTCASAYFPLSAMAEPREEKAPVANQKASLGEPRLVHKVNPVYPEDAKKDHIQGVVHVAARLGKDGAVAEAKATDGHATLAEAAVAAVRQWRYEPVLGADKKPVEVSLTITINFRLDE
jgi:D-alanyl-D-alanine endopeptidase (penicillin-binding protein 7)